MRNGINNSSALVESNIDSSSIGYSDPNYKTGTSEYEEGSETEE